jgi:uncharacterized repeat protein (TIGR01451 family)
VGLAGDEMNLIRLIAQWWVVFLALSGTLVAQHIDSFTPTVGSAGDLVTLNGSGFFTPGVTVSFWQNQTATINFISGDSLMTVYVPNGITLGPIGIGTGGGLAYTASNFIPTGPGPYITDFSPAYGAAGDPTTTIAINGVHFTGSTASGVTFNGVPSTDASVSSDGTYIGVHVPAGATSGPLQVTTPAGTSTNVTYFTVVGPGPYVADFSPVSGSPSTLVYIDGIHLAGVTNVTFNGKPGNNLFVQSDIRLQVNPPAGVTTGPVAVFSAQGAYTTSSNFFVQPVLTGFSPANGRAGTNVTITGSNLLGATSVTFNFLAAASYSVLNNSNILAVAPTGATTGLIFVVTPAGSAPAGTNFVVQPTVYGFSPGIGIVGSPITVLGANFNVGTPTVRFNGVASGSVSGVGFSQLTAAVPAGATTGTISVSTKDGSHTNSSLFYLPPAITTFTPTNRAPGTQITVTGTNFLGTTAVNFSGAAAAGFTVSNNGTLVATVPVGLSTGPISVTAPAGTATSGGLYYAAPIITNFVPTHGLPGTNVTINGLNFLGATSVQFSGLNAAIGSVNNGQIVATVPNGAQNGPITVIAPAGTNTTATSFLLDYTSDLEAQLADSPDPVIVTSNLTYTITIVNHGPFNAPNVRMTNMLPASVALTAASITQGTLATNSNPIIGTIGTVNAGNSLNCVLTVAPRATGYITNTVSVGSDYPDPAPANNKASVSTFVSSLPVLFIDLAASNRVSLSWPLDLSNFVLQSKGAVTAGGWTNIPTPPVISNNENIVTDPNGAARKFYRLKE